MILPEFSFYAIYCNNCTNLLTCGWRRFHNNRNQQGSQPIFHNNSTFAMCLYVRCHLPILLYILQSFSAKVSNYLLKKSFVFPDVICWFSQDTVSHVAEWSDSGVKYTSQLPHKKIHICYLYVYQRNNFTDIRGTLMALEHISSKEQH